MFIFKKEVFINKLYEFFRIWRIGFTVYPG